MSEQKAKLFLSFLLAIIAVSALAGVSYTFFPSQQEIEKTPVASPTAQPTMTPSIVPSSIPTTVPSPVQPSSVPTGQPTIQPSYPPPTASPPPIQPTPSSSNSPSTPLSLDLSPDPGVDGFLSISRGESASIALILTSHSDKTQHTIPVYLAIGAYENQPLQSGYKILVTPPEPYSSQLPWSSSHIDQSNDTLPFTAALEINPLTIEPMSTAISEITFEAAQDAKTGVYSILVELGNWEQTNLGGTTFQLKVEP